MSDTICAKFLETTERYADKMAILYPKNTQWLEVTWASYLETVEHLAAGLYSLGVRAGDRVAVMAETRPEWSYADMAILGLGAITVPIYHNNTVEDVQFILNDSKAKILIVESTSLAGRLKEATSATKSLEKIVMIEPPKAGLEFTDSSTPMTWNHLLELGAAQLLRHPRLYKESALSVNAEDVATVLYTSGTTGKPKGVVLLHSCAMSEVGEVFPLLGVTHRDRSLSFMPFAHILGRIEIWGHAFIGYTMGFAGSIDTMKDDMVTVKPTVMVAVPRVFEKIYNGILAQAEISPIRKRVFDWAIGVGKRMSQYKVDKMPVPIDLALTYKVAKRLVFDQLAEKMGGHLRFTFSGGAPLNPQIATFFHAAGLLLLEGYGLTETTAAVFINTPFDYRFGTVGKAIGDVKIKLAQDGEILVKSKKVMREYYNNSDATRESLEDGWLHTGDIGELSPEGYLKITDRKKDLIKTAGGKYVAPQKIEGLLKLNQFISNVHVHGDQRKYVVALVTLNFSAVERFAADQDISYKDREALCQNSKIRELVRHAIADVNSQLASYESIKNFAIISRDFTMETGELTPSLKVKRKVVDTNYAEAIDRLYGPSGAGHGGPGADRGTH